MDLREKGPWEGLYEGEYEIWNGTSDGISMNAGRMMQELTLLVIRSEVQGLPQDRRRCHLSTWTETRQRNSKSALLRTQYNRLTSADGIGRIRRRPTGSNAMERRLSEIGSFGSIRSCPTLGSGCYGISCVLKQRHLICVSAWADHRSICSLYPFQSSAQHGKKLTSKRKRRIATRWTSGCACRHVGTRKVPEERRGE
jgi:hypothetical protein